MWVCTVYNDSHSFLEIYRIICGIHKMNVLFLDFDGPMIAYKDINTFSDEAIPAGLDLHPFIKYWKMDKKSVDYINALRKIYPFKTVISSSWKKYVDFPNLKKLLQLNGVDVDFHDDPIAWRMSFSGTTRDQDIHYWLSENPVDDYIILDDEDSGTGLTNNFFNLKNIHLVNPYEGLDDKTFHSMKKIVTGWKNASN